MYGAAEGRQVVQHGNPIQKGEVNGMNPNRSCTDIAFLLLFIAFAVGSFIIAGFAFREGDYRRLTRGIDYKGRICGVDQGVENARYLYWPNPLKTELGVCLTACPTNTTTGSVTVTDTTGTEYSYPYYATKTVLKRFCFPAIAAEAATERLKASTNIANQAVGDVAESWKVILGCAFISVAFGFLFLVLVRLFAPCFVWLAIIGAVVGITLLGIFLLKKSQQTAADPNADKDNANTQKAFAIVCFVAAAVLVIVVIFLFNRIRLAITLLQATTRAVFAMPGLVFQPFVSFIITALFIAYWTTVLVFLASAGEVSPATKNIGGISVQVKSVKFDDKLRNMIWYHLFGLFWGSEFIEAIFNFVVAGAVVTWYFTKPVPGTTTDERKPEKPILTAIWYAFRYHLGSLAFGSLIIAAVKMVRFILAYLHEQQKKVDGNNTVLKVIFGCLQCFLACFERCLKFINKHAYIQMAINGTNFFESCKKGFELIMRNVARVAAIQMIATPFLFLGKIFISCGTAAIAYIILTQASEYTVGGASELSTPLIPAAIVLVIGWIVGTAFMQVFDMGVETMFQCFLVDTEMNGGNLEYTPDELEKFISSNSKASETTPIARA